MAAQLQIPMISAFSPAGEPSTVAQRWQKWVKSFQYFITASGITDGDRKRAMLLHLVGSETQDIFETLENNHSTSLGISGSNKFQSILFWHSLHELEYE